MNGVKIEEQNFMKNLKKLSNLIIIAKGYERTINGFAADCNTNAEYMANIVNCKVKELPQRQFLKLISDNSQGRVSYNNLLIASGYSLYDSNSIDEIKNVYIRRGWIAYVDFSDNVLDSEYGGSRLSLIIQNDKGNMYSSTTIVIPLTSRKTKAKLPTHVEIESKFGLSQDSIISCEQIRCISKRRLLTNGIVQKIAECPEWIMEKVEIALLKAEGVVDLYVSEERAIEVLRELNQSNSYNYNNNYNRQPGFALA